MRITFLFLIATCLLASCSSKQKQIVGTWQMKGVFNDGVDVSEEHNPENDRWISFDSDGNYSSGGSPYGSNTGKWSFNDEGFLFLDSDADEGDDSYWEVSIQKDQMTWKGAVFEFTKTFSIEMERSEVPSS